MPKPIRAHWFLQALANNAVSHIAPDIAIIPVVEHDDEQIVWGEECEDVGRVAWHCGYILPSDDPALRALLPIFNTAMAPWQERYDLGLTWQRQR